jgi:preprotein translocase subunit YajC
MNKKDVRRLFIRMSSVIIILLLLVIFYFTMYRTRTAQVQQLEQQLETVTIQLEESKKQ